MVQIMRIVYKRKLKKEDFTNFNDQIIYFKDDNIAFVIVEYNNSYIIRQKKIFNNKQISEFIVKTVTQVLKKVE